MLVEILMNLASITNILLLTLGTFAGIIFGALPGLSAVIGITLLLPLTYGVDIYASMVLLLGVYCGAMYGGSISAILISTPGTASAAATMLDGHPMAASGKAGKALDIALKSSFSGGILSGLALMLVAPLLAKAALEFGPPEMFGLALIGLTIIPSVVGDSPKKGFLACMLGLFVGTVGYDPINGLTRMTFGVIRLTSGIQLVPSLIGIFAFSQILTNVFNADDPADEVTEFHDTGCKWSEILKYKLTIIRSSLIGIFIGAIPGTGAALASFISYNEAKKAAKNPEDFGKGNPEGIVAAETANNAVTGAALIPTLTLGIPGDPSTAVMIGAFMINGITPGPRFFSTEPVLAYFIIAVIFCANIMMYLQASVLIKFFAKVMKVPMNILLPILAVLTIVGAYAVNSAMFDVYTMVIFGIFGFILNKFNIPKVPFVIARILGSMAESNLRRGLIMSGGSFSIFFTRPISLVCVLVSVITLLYPYISKKLKERKSISA